MCRTFAAHVPQAPNDSDLTRGREHIRKAHTGMTFPCSSLFPTNRQQATHQTRMPSGLHPSRGLLLLFPQWGGWGTSAAWWLMLTLGTLLHRLPAKSATIHLGKLKLACCRTLNAHHPTSNESPWLPRVLSAKDGHEIGAQIFHRHGLQQVFGCNHQFPMLNTRPR